VSFLIFKVNFFGSYFKLQGESMQLLSLLLVLVLLASCGKTSSTSGSGAGSPIPRQAQEDTSEQCDLNGHSVSCESLEGADGLGVDLLTTSIDVPIAVTPNSILFMAAKNSQESGRRISCSTAVEQGENYGYELNGDTLTIQNSKGQFNYKRLTDGSSINGTWTWRGYVDTGTHVNRTLTIISMNRAIMKSHCEL